MTGNKHIDIYKLIFSIKWSRRTHDQSVSFCGSQWGHKGKFQMWVFWTILVYICTLPNGLLQIDVNISFYRSSSCLLLFVILIFFWSWYIFCPCLPTFKTFSRALPSVPFLLYSNSHGELTAGCCPFVRLFRSPCVNITGLTGPVCHNLLVRNERIADADSFVDYLNTLRPNSREPAARCWQRGSSSFHRKNNR